MTDPSLSEAAARAYIYGYPLVYNLGEIAKLPRGDSILGVPVPWNTFGSARRLLGPEAKFVTPNNDTLYTVAPCDVSQGPLVLSVPDTAQRYYVLQFVDAWTNNFAYVGRRATGTAAAEFVLAPAGWSGDAGGRRVIHAPTDVFVIVGRVQVDGDADLDAVHALQDGFGLQPLEVPAGALAGIPAPGAGVDHDLAWWEQFRVALAAFPPPAADADVVAALEPLGLGAAASPYEAPDQALADALVAGQRQGAATVEDVSRTSLKIVDGWSSAMHGFDYNLDYFELGTIDAPEWKLDDRTTASVARAAAARAGLWGNHGYEARYDLLWQDEHGDELSGAHRYELTLSPPPDVGAFWSLTMYDEPDYYLVRNPIDRYSIGDRTPGLIVGADGSVVIRMQVDPPSHADGPVNWLPAPPGAFRPVLRAYEPHGSALDGTLRLPPVRRLA